MILVFDTSALIKRYITESDTDVINAAWTTAGLLAASWITEAEMLATFARKRREAVLPADGIDTAERRFLADWPGFVRVEPYRVSTLLPGLHRTYSLRGADSVHLATAVLLRSLTPEETIAFATADDRLVSAAKGEGVDVLP